MEIDGYRLFSGGCKLHRQSVLLVPPAYYGLVREAQEWDYGVYIDVEGTNIRIISAHLPDSWKPMEVFMEALASLDAILDVGKHTVLAGDLNVELGSLRDDITVGARATHARRENDLERAQAVFQLMVEKRLVAASTFDEGVDYRRVDHTTHHHWASEAAKTLDYIIVSRGMVAKSVTEIFTEVRTDHDCLQMDIAIESVCPARLPVRRDGLKPTWEPYDGPSFAKASMGICSDSLAQMSEELLVTAQHYKPRPKWYTASPEEVRLMSIVANAKGGPKQRAMFALRKMRRAQRLKEEHRAMEKMVQEGGKGWRKQESRRMLYRYTNKISGIPRSALTLKDFEDFWSKVYDTNWADRVAFQRVLAEMLGSIPEESQLEAIPKVDGESLRAMGKKMKNTSAGMDGIAPVVFKYLPDTFWRELAKHFNQCIVEARCPREWQQLQVSLIPKTPFASMAKNFRPIAIANAFERLLDLYLLTHLKKLPFQWHSHQYARKGKQPMEAMSFVRVLHHHCYTHSVPCVTVKLDIAKAYDSVDHMGLLRMMQNRGIDSWLIRAIM
eukprot:6492332-Amphidinium_carterae.2